MGFLILSVLLTPIAEFKEKKLILEPEYEEYSHIPLKSSVSRELKENVEKDIEERLDEEFGIKAEAEVEIDVDEEHNIKGVRRIKIKTRNNPGGLDERLEEVYGCERIEFE